MQQNDRTRAKADVLAELETMQVEAEQTDSSEYADECHGHFVRQVGALACREIACSPFCCPSTALSLPFFTAFHCLFSLPFCCPSTAISSNDLSIAVFTASLMSRHCPFTALSQRLCRPITTLSLPFHGLSAVPFTALPFTAVPPLPFHRPFLTASPRRSPSWTWTTSSLSAGQSWPRSPRSTWRPLPAG